MKEQVSINNIIFKHYIENYWIDNKGTLARIEFDKNKEVVFFKVLKQETSQFGHKRVEIKINMKPKKILIHRAVYEVWVGKLIEGMVIEHLDGNPANNHVSNLKQSTQKENIQTAIAQQTFYQMWSNKTHIMVFDKITNETKGYESVKDFFIDIQAPEYMIRHGGLSSLNKRKDLKDRFIIERIGRKGKSQQTSENVSKEKDFRE